MTNAVSKVPTSDPKDTDKKSDATASLSEVFMNAEPFDYLLMSLGILGGAVTGLSLPAMNIVFGRLLNTINGTVESLTEGIAKLCVIIVVIAGMNVFSGFLQVYCWTKTGERQTQKFREKYVNAILSQEIGWFDTCGAGELSTRVAELTGKVQDGTGRKAGDLIQYVAQILGSFAAAFWLCWKLTVVLIACFPVIAFAGAFMINAITSAQNQTLGQYAAAGGLATESLGAIRTITALNAQPDVIARYRKFLFDAMQVGIVKGFKVGLGNGGLFFVLFCTYALGFWYGGKLVADDLDSGCQGKECMSGGTIISVFFCTIMGSMALGQMAPPLTAFTTARAAVASMLEVIRRTPLIDGLSQEGLVPSEEQQQHTSGGGVIQISDVSFAYPSRPNIEVCKNYNLTINAGESIALVGASGCGKSTIINLLLRFYDPQSGRITLDGRDIKSLNIRWLRSQIGYVGQEPVLFAGTIGDNISYGLDPELLGNTAATANSPKKLSKEKLQEMIVNAAKLANAHSFISDFPQGYDTDVGSNGVAMSGGQKQRIAIARALIKKPSILLLDEATSALDAASERVVQASIDALQQMKSQSIVIIAHRLSTIRNADRICLIDKGSIAEMGSHDELIAKNGLYADLVSLQMNGDEDDALVSGADASGGVSPSSPRDRKRTVSSGGGASAVAAPVERDIESPAEKVEEEGAAAETPAEAKLDKEQSKKVASRVWAMLREHTGWMVVGCLGAAVFGATFPSWGLMLAHSENMFFLNDTTEMRRQARLYAGLYILLGGVCLISATCQFWGVAQVAERVSIRLRSQMFEALMRRNIGYFDLEENSIGTLTTRLSDDSRIVNKAFGDSLARQLQAVFCLLVALILGFNASWRVALVVIAAFPVNIIASAIHMQASSGQQYESEDKIQGAVTFNGGDNAKAKAQKQTAAGGVLGGGHGAVISTAFTHMRTVSAFSMQHKVSEHYASLTNQQAEERAGRAVIAGFGFGGAQTAMFCTYALLFWYGGTLVKSGDVTFLDLMTAILTLMLGALGLGTALADLGDQKVGVETAHRIFQAIDEGNSSPIDGLSTTGVVPSAKATGRIVITNVNFRYPTREDVQVCKDFSLEIEPGEMVALVGPSGSGKSTIISLLQRFYDPLSGTITLDGHDTKSLNVRWLRSQIGFVGQEPVLFTGSVAQNVAKGRVDSVLQPVMSLSEAMQSADASSGGWGAYFDCLKKEEQREGHSAVSTTDEVEGDIEMGKGSSAAPAAADPDVIEACMASNAHDFISSFTQGYDTDIGEGSIMVSGGQKQRIAIARALIKKPSILLLDEATSALDAASERVVQASIDALQAQKTQTTIVIAHRLSTIKSADKIIVVDKGVVVEMGRHEELLQKKGGLYAQLWAKQSGTSGSGSAAK